jgi:hypothetical protein
VADAFESVQRTAVQAAVGQANLRKGVNQVFLNLSLRNQSLLHRQLGMLDAMERATDEPAALADLFRLDHLTTRMRRHAENLIILSGATPGRGWRDPVPVVDVLRAAIGEVEDYIRVDVASDGRDAVVGSAVNDVIHLVAELIENATTFSPPSTQVEIRADAVANGFAVEIEDRGLGLPQRSWPRSMRGWPARPSSTWPTAISSACSSWASWPPGRGSRSRCGIPRSAARPPSCCCRRAWWSGKARPGRRPALARSGGPGWTPGCCPPGRWRRSPTANGPRCSA